MGEPLSTLDLAALRAVSRDEASAVSAHGLLNSSAIVSMGITTLQAHWDKMPAADRLQLLRRMLEHASFVDDSLKSLMQGQLSVGPSPSPSEV